MATQHIPPLLLAYVFFGMGYAAIDPDVRRALVDAKRYEVAVVLFVFVALWPLPLALDVVCGILWVVRQTRSKLGL